MPSTVGVSPKTIAAGVAALITPFLAKTLGLDESILLGVVTAIVTAIVAYLAPPGHLQLPAPDQDLDDPSLPSTAPVPTLTEAPTASALAHSRLDG